MTIRRQILRIRFAVAGSAIWMLGGLAGAARGQESPETGGGPLPDYAHYYPQPLRGGPVFNASTNGLPNILLTGYWPPTNEMLRQFSPNPVQNPGGWVGENWEGRGYNVYAYFPEFPVVVERGEGDFEVDYQDTSNDFWPLANAMTPIALTTFSRGADGDEWNVEGGNRTYASTAWTNDYLNPLKPTPELPISGEPPLTERFNGLPMQAIVDNVNTSGATVTPYIAPMDHGRFLSNYIGYHGNWYQDLHADVIDSQWIVSGGHIHVGVDTLLPDAVLAAEVTVRTLLQHVDARRALLAQGDLNGDGDIDLFDHARFAECMGGPGETSPEPGCHAVRFGLADLDHDGDVDLADYAPLSERIAELAPALLALPFNDPFPDTVFDPAKWELTTGSAIDGVGLAMPSAPYAARLNGAPTFADVLVSRPIDLGGVTGARLRYAWQRRGGGDSPEVGDDLFAEFQAANGNWRRLLTHLGNGTDMIVFQLQDVLLPPEALHRECRIRFHNIGSGPGTGAGNDDWFLDDVSVVADGP